MYDYLQKFMWCFDSIFDLPGFRGGVAVLTNKLMCGEKRGSWFREKTRLSLLHKPETGLLGWRQTRQTE
jgi:hypothetical protein